MRMRHVGHVMVRRFNEERRNRVPKIHLFTLKRREETPQREREREKFTKSTQRNCGFDRETLLSL